LWRLDNGRQKQIPEMAVALQSQYVIVVMMDIDTDYDEKTRARLSVSTGPFDSSLAIHAMMKFPVYSI
jgi:hypothetical protein